MTKTAKLYGGSLYDLAAEEQLTDKLLAEMEIVDSLFSENTEYLRLLSEPSVPKAERISLLDQAFQGKIQIYLLNFLKILCENGTLREYSGCCRVFRNRYNEDHNIAEATVTSAVMLSTEQTDALKKKLEQMSGKTVLLTQKIDSRVLGGLRVQFEDIELDGTAQARLDGLRRSIMS